MRIDIITLFPELLESPFGASIVNRAIEGNKVEIHFHDPRDYSSNNYRQVDDYPYGGGAGMVMMVEPLDKCIAQLQSERRYDEVIYMTPDGETLTQPLANRCSLYENIIILCGHYKGVDQRVRDHLVTREISLAILSSREGAGRRCVLRQHHPADPGGAGRRILSFERQLPRRPAGPTHLHSTSQLQGLGSAPHPHLWQHPRH